MKTEAVLQDSDTQNTQGQFLLKVYVTQPNHGAVDVDGTSMVGSPPKEIIVKMFKMATREVQPCVGMPDAEGDSEDDFHFVSSNQMVCAVKVYSTVWLIKNGTNHEVQDGTEV